jgi:hypothetical protein
MTITADDDQADMTELEILLTTTEAAEYTGIPVGTIELLRVVGLGPRSYEIEGREVYRVIDIDEWRTSGAFVDEIRHGIGRVTDALVEMAGAVDLPTRSNRVSTGQVVAAA